MSRSTLTDITVIVKLETDRAWLINDGDKEVWLPKSQCEIVANPDGKTWTATLPQWLAEEKGLV